tara:strand:+ start:2103 stop:2219 length:117 start_codon:yes stop_codon:yes gene_type:complete
MKTLEILQKRKQKRRKQKSKKQKSEKLKGANKGKIILR